MDKKEPLDSQHVTDARPPTADQLDPRGENSSARAAASPQESAWQRYWAIWGICLVLCGRRASDQDRHPAFVERHDGHQRSVAARCGADGGRRNQ